MLQKTGVIKPGWFQRVLSGYNRHRNLNVPLHLFSNFFRKKYLIRLFFYSFVQEQFPHMNGYKAYDIKDKDRFNPYLFPEVRDELNGLFSATYFFTTPEKENIIISFLKNHSLKSEWIRGNPELTHLLTDNCCPTGHIESLFEAAKTNLQFLHSFEEYIRNISVE